MDIEQAPPSSDSDAATAPVPETMSDESAAAVMSAVLSAVMNGSTETIPDNLGREWLVCPDIVDNQSTILIRVTKGIALAYRGVSTAQLINPQSAEDAITALDGELR